MGATDGIHDSTGVRVPALAAGELLAGEALVIDLRSPAEFAEDHVPGAHNVPLFDDTERALIGTLYRRESPERAFREGREIVVAHIHELCARIARLAGETLGAEDLAARVRAATERGIDELERVVAAVPVRERPAHPVVLHCWRGGLRSRSVAWLLRSIGFERVHVLQGGYRAWRSEIVRFLEGARFPPAFVLRGLTGVGKTLVLRELERLHPGWTIDLEALAGHRSSLLGMVGLEPVSQKRFESRLFARLRQGLGPVVVFEGESRKVGDVILPRELWRALSGGTSIELVTSVERRVEVLEQDYLAAPGCEAELLRQLPLLEARVKRASGEPGLCERLRAGEVDELVRVLLERHYDPLYRHGEQGRHCATRVDSTVPARAAREIASWIEAQSTSGARGTADSLG